MVSVQRQPPGPKNVLFIEPEIALSRSASPLRQGQPEGHVSAPTPSAQPSLAPSTGLSSKGVADEDAITNTTQSIALRDPALSSGADALPAVNATPGEYYGGREVWTRARTFSNVGVTGLHRRRPMEMDGESITRPRRLSHDEISQTAPRRFLIDVEETMRVVLQQEDTDGNFQISVHDSGPKLLAVGTAGSNAHKSFDIRGNYMLSNLLQELAYARDYGRKQIVLDEARLLENPVDRLSRMIKNSFWDALTRRVDADGLERICVDPKNRSREKAAIMYVPHGEDDILEYYKNIVAERNMKVEIVMLPPHCDDPAFVKSLNDRPGNLALAFKRGIDPITKQKTLEPIPFIVPGDRFNEKYGWDSYFIALGLLVDGRVDLAKALVEHCIFEIQHYRKVLNGTRTYASFADTSISWTLIMQYLTRSHPPFLTDMALQTFNAMDRVDHEENKAFLRRAIQAAIKEYHTYWMVTPALDPVSGLSRYRPTALGVAPETEASHFTHIIQPYATKRGISVNEYIDQYNDGAIHEPELDEYMLHDRGVRESGHDTSYRLDKKAANLGTVDQNALLYKYEIDIAQAIQYVFDDHLDLDWDFALSPWPITPEAFAEGSPRKRSLDEPMSSKIWYERAATRKATMDRLCWNEGLGTYFDYDTVLCKQARYESVTALWPLWAGPASDHQAQLLVRHALPKYEVAGGLVSGTEESRGPISLDRPNRQWDYPYGWPPHQIVAWVGLERYGYLEEVARLAYRWIYMLTVSVVDFNAVVPEKFDVVEMSHIVDAEYGNQGTKFRYASKEGFGWMNASFQIGLNCLTVGMRRAIAALPWVYFSLPKPDFATARRRRLLMEARMSQAAAEGHGGVPKQTVHLAHPSLEDAIAKLKLDLKSG